MKRILIVEDEEALRDNIADLLEAEQYEVLTAEDGLEGVRIARENLPDLIICDIMMPGLDGLGVLKEVRATSGTATIPFLFLTAKADHTDIRTGMTEGADDYLTKPFRRADLLNAIRSRLDKADVVNVESARKLTSLRTNIALALPHELLTPLNGILGLSEILADDAATISPPEIAEMALSIHHSAVRLHRIIQNILTFARLELMKYDSAERSRFASARFRCTGEQVKQVVHDRAREVNRVADMNVAASDAFLVIDGEDFLKILQEVVDNAFKFSAQGSPVEVTADRSGKYYTVSVIDKGRGFSPEQLSHNGAFVQHDRVKFEQQGSGLGLTIARLIAESYGGSLAIESNSRTTVRISVIIADSPAG